MGRLEKQLDPNAGPLARFATDLRDLRRGVGSPTYRELGRIAGYSPSALSAAASGASLPSAGVLAAYVKACGGDVPEWLDRRIALSVELAAHDPANDEQQPERVAKRRTPWRVRIAGLAAAAVLGSLATVVPMAVWGAPSCPMQNGGHPVPASTCAPR